MKERGMLKKTYNANLKLNWNMKLFIPWSMEISEKYILCQKKIEQVTVNGQNPWWIWKSQMEIYISKGDNKIGINHKVYSDSYSISNMKLNFFSFFFVKCKNISPDINRWQIPRSDNNKYADGFTKIEANFQKVIGRWYRKYHILRWYASRWYW